VFALIENYGTSKPLNFSPEKSQILICDILVANERDISLKSYKYDLDKINGALVV
jgi:hypothetical protein